VFLLDVPREVLVDRLAGRRICRGCGAVYHVRNIPPRAAGVCDACGGELYQRPDDTEETVLNRLEVFRKQTESLIEYYEKQGVLVRINAGRNRELVQRDILDALRKPASGT
jgi:adenylate kinase